MRWPALRWFVVVVAVVMLQGNVARAAPRPRNEDMFRELLKLDQMYSSIARPRFGKRAESNSDFPAVDYEGQQLVRGVQLAIHKLVDVGHGSAMGCMVALLLLVLAVCGSMSTYQDCGKSVRRSRQPRLGAIGRIIHGKQSVRGAWPWQVSLQLLHPQFGFLGHWCGGVMISTEWLLTAAHCIHNDLFNLPLAALWTAVLGDWDREVEEYSEERIPIDEIILHERFHNFQHDIALMKLARPVKLMGESRVRAVCLPTKRFSHNQTDLCIATGWGRDAEDGFLSGKLLESRVPVHDNGVCRKKYGHAVNIRSGHLCAGHLDGTSGTCVGDSGGPLQCANREGRWILAGITSFGSGCAKPGFPDVYTRLSYYLPWIRAKTRSVRP